MATDKLVGNMPTENLISYFESKNLNLKIDLDKFSKITQNRTIFDAYK